jgi:dipeptidyl aminopeptidase/acylaminoacyl peptidase
MANRVAPYGAWASPLTAEMLVSDAVDLANPFSDGADTYWVEIRFADQGRYVLVRRGADGVVSDLTPDGHSVRTLVHEYGGRSYVVRGGTVFYSNFADQRLYRLERAGASVPITPVPPTPRAYRYAAPVVTPDGRWVIAVRERHLAEGVVNDLVRVPADGSADPEVMAFGHDFFADPVLSPDGRRLAWIAWDHPNMPWDGTALFEAELDPDGGVVGVRLVCGGPAESVVQPAYGADGTLYYVSDRTDWWNLYADGPGGPQPLAPMDAEFARPLWQLGGREYAPQPDGSVVAAWFDGGRWRIGRIEQTGELREFPTEWTAIGRLHPGPGGVLCLAASPRRYRSVVQLDARSGQSTVVRASRQLRLDEAYVSEPEPIEFPTDAGLTAHAFFYPPTNPEFDAPEGTSPPLLVSTHGGPTGHVDPVILDDVQYWTSRGFGVVQVNYGGSTGYGRAYRERLKGAWGIVDLDDCVNAAKYLAVRGSADPDKLLIDGGSAGGYTTLCALTFRSDFAAGASFFGVTDLAGLARDTHKFESRYLDGLVGPYPERQDLYDARSPLVHADLIRTPTILFQGLEDEVVPPQQAEAMAAALRESGVPFAYIAFPGEQHGFRIAQNIVRTAEAELWFFGRVLGFTPADDIPPVKIENEAALASH